MISYLLSGWRVFVPDANGQPLYRGRVYFYDASTSEPSAVYQEKEKVTSLGTYVDVDNHGFLPPIWLDSSHLYKCVVKRLIQNDPETWQTLWEIDDVGNPFITADTDDGSSTIMVNDIALLRSIDVTSDERPDYVSVAGWFNPGDTGSPMVFCWREGEVHNEDGHWVKPNSSASLGTWEQILDDELDPRKFGAIPDTGNAVDSALVNCMRYACEPHVQDVSDPTIYKPRTVKFVRSGNYKLNGNFDFADYSMIPAFGSTPVPVVIGDGVYFDGTAEFGQGARIESSQAIGNNFIIKDKETHLRTSWYGNKLNIVASSPRVIVIDDDIGSTTLPFTGKVIINLLDTLPSNLMLTDCVVIDAHNGSLAPTLLKLGKFTVSHGTNGSGEDSLIFKKGLREYLELHQYITHDQGGSAIYTDVVRAAAKMLLEEGFETSALDGFKASLSKVGNEWQFYSSRIGAAIINGTLNGYLKPPDSYGYKQCFLKNPSTVQNNYSRTDTINLPQGCVGFVIIVYENGMPGYLTENLVVGNTGKKVVVSISARVNGSSAGSLAPIRECHVGFWIMNLGDQVACGCAQMQYDYNNGNTATIITTVENE